MRKHIYTTNVVESINAGLEYIRMEHGGYFASLRMLELNLFIQLANMHDRWLSQPIPNLAGVSYRLKQIFAMKFESTDIKNVLDLQSVAGIENA